MKCKCWWYENGWRIRVKIYTYLRKPIDMLRFILKLSQLPLDLIDKFLIWFLWKFLDVLFKYRKIGDGK